MSAPAERWILRVTASGDSAPLPDSGALVVGSSSDRAELRIDDASVAGTHFAVGRLKGGGWAVRDLGSPGGTRLNGEPIASGRLAPGDRLRAGEAELVVVDLDAPAPSDDAGTQTGKKNGVSGIRIGGYRVESPLGRGSMGQVVLAVQENLDRRVALKILPPKLADDGAFLRRFQSEARAAAALSHPNVVVVYDVGHADGHHYLAMEYMEGGNLEERIAKSGPLPWRQVLDILCDATAGLVFAETQGILHRDIKPANLMQTGAGMTKIADLGLATGHESEARDQRIFGTPHFMAPEQARGESVDHRADLYALGGTAFRLLTGRTPFEGETTRDILRAKLTGEPPSVRSLVPGVPPELERIVAALLKREPAERTASAATLAAELDSLRVRVQAAEVHPGGGGKKLVVLGLFGAAAAAAAAFFFLPRGDDADRSSRVQLTGSEAVASELLPALPTKVEETASSPDEDRLLAAFEAEAERALGNVRLDPEEEAEARIDALRAHARRFAGTDASARALSEADDIESRLAARARSADAATELSARIEAELAPLAGATEQPLALRLAALSAHVPAGEFAASVEYQSALARTQVALVTEATEDAREALARAEAFAVAGEFDAYRAELESLAARFDADTAGEEDDAEEAEVEDTDEGEASADEASADEASAEETSADDSASAEEATPEVAGAELGLTADADKDLRRAVERWSSLRAEVSTALDGVEERRHAHLEALRREDALAVSSTMREPGGIDELLFAGDYSAARARLDELLGSVRLGATRDRLSPLVESVLAGEAALAALVHTHEADAWRRRSVADPRATRGIAAEIAELDAQGLTLDVRGESTRLPWSEFLSTPDNVHGLFHNRLERDWSADERAGIAVLARVAAAGRARVLLGGMLARTPDNEALRAARAELEASFDLAAQWADAPGSARALARERTAMEKLAQVIEDIVNESWPSAVAGLEQLLAAYPETLLVSFLSDGAPWQVAEVPAEETGDPPSDEDA